jgi:DNA invertase Pin-like site-specific DNA recombinase
VAARQGLEVVDEFVDNDRGASRYSRKARPRWSELLERLGRGEFDTLIAWDLDRLTRQPRELEHLIGLTLDRGVRILTVSGSLDLSTTSAQLQARILAAIAAGEVDKMSARMKARHEDDARRGLPYAGRLTYGYATATTLDDHEAAVMREMVARVTAGDSCTRIAHDLNGRGVVTKKGARWQSASVKFAVSNPHIAGLRRYRGEVLDGVEGKWPAIVSPAEWHAAQQMLALRSNGRRRGAPGTLLAGVVWCAECGGKLYRNGPAHDHKRSKDASFRHAAREAGACSVSVAAVALESWTVERVLELVGDEATRGATAPPAATPRADEVGLIRAKLEQLGRDHADDLIPRDAFIAAARTLRERLDKAEAAVVLEPTAADREAARLVARGPSNLRAEWPTVPLHIRRSIVRLLLSRIEIEARPGVRKFDPSRVRLVFAA